MNWSVGALLDDALDAWSADNWPYTLAFWVTAAIVVAVFQHINRRDR